MIRLFREEVMLERRVVAPAPRLQCVSNILIGQARHSKRLSVSFALTSRRLRRPYHVNRHQQGIRSWVVKGIASVTICKRFRPTFGKFGTRSRHPIHSSSRQPWDRCRPRRVFTVWSLHLLTLASQTRNIGVSHHFDVMNFA
jgi:hypothetical protein